MAQSPQTTDDRDIVVRAIVGLKTKQAALGVSDLSGHILAFIAWLEDSVREFQKEARDCPAKRLAQSASCAPASEARLRRAGKQDGAHRMGRSRQE